MSLHTIGKTVIYTLPHIQVDGSIITDPRFGQGLEGPLGSLAYSQISEQNIGGTLPATRIYQKNGNSAKEWRILNHESLGSLDFATHYDADYTAIDTAPHVAAGFDMTYYSQKILAASGNNFMTVEVQAVARQVADTGSASPEGAVNDSILIKKSFGFLYVQGVDGFLTPLQQTDVKIGIDNGGGVGVTNDLEMNFVADNSAFGLRIDILVSNGIDNGGGDSGRDMSWDFNFKTSTFGKDFTAN